MMAITSGRRREPSIMASTDPTRTALWMLWTASHSAATSLIFPARSDAVSASAIPAQRSSLGWSWSASEAPHPRSRELHGSAAETTHCKVAAERDRAGGPGRSGRILDFGHLMASSAVSLVAGSICLLGVPQSQSGPAEWPSPRRVCPGSYVQRATASSDVSSTWKATLGMQVDRQVLLQVPAQPILAKQEFNLLAISSAPPPIHSEYRLVMPPG